MDMGRIGKRKTGAGFGFVGIAALTVSLVLSACGGAPAEDGQAAADKQPYVLATTGMIADLAVNIAGDEFRVESMMAPGIDPHLYKASEGDVRKLADADVVLYNGLNLEGKMGDILKKMSNDKPVIAIAEGLPEEELHESADYPGENDPHIWFNTALWSETIDPVVVALSAQKPESADKFRAQGEQYRSELLELDKWVTSRISEIPPESRVLVTAHDAFGYFGSKYGMEVVGIQGISTISEAGLSDMNRVVDLLVDRKIKAIFVESSVPRRTVEAVQAASRERGHDVVIGGELFSDSMGAPGTEEGTYVGMVRHNVNTIVNALR